MRRAFRPEDSSALAEPEFHRVPVLYLEDEPETARVFETLLRKTEFQPMLAATVAQAEAWMLRRTPAAIVAEVYIGGEPIWQPIRFQSRQQPVIQEISRFVDSRPIAPS
jgi:DNA-binding response OmpR family regulator